MVQPSPNPRRRASAAPCSEQVMSQYADLEPRIDFARDGLTYRVTGRLEPLAAAARAPPSGNPQFPGPQRHVPHGHLNPALLEAAAHAWSAGFGRDVVLPHEPAQIRHTGYNRGLHRLLVQVRDNNVDQALKALKKKMQREGIFREMKLRNYYEKPSERRVREQAEAVRRARKLARKKAQREGLLPGKPATTTRPGAPGARPGGGRPGGPPRSGGFGGGSGFGGGGGFGGASGGGSSGGGAVAAAAAWWIWRTALTRAPLQQHTQTDRGPGGQLRVLFFCARPTLSSLTRAPSPLIQSRTTGRALLPLQVEIAVLALGQDDDPLGLVGQLAAACGPWTPVSRRPACRAGSAAAPAPWGSPCRSRSGRRAAAAPAGTDSRSARCPAPTYRVPPGSARPRLSPPPCGSRHWCRATRHTG